MADYREISQQYAQGGIKAVILLNGGAAVAILTQLSQLSALSGPILWAMCFWAAGTASGAFAWMMGFGSTRYVDKHYDEGIRKHIDTANRFQTAGLAAVFIALVLFLIGCLVLAVGYYQYYRPYQGLAS